MVIKHPINKIPNAKFKPFDNTKMATDPSAEIYINDDNDESYVVNDDEKYTPLFIEPIVIDIAFGVNCCVIDSSDMDRTIEILNNLTNDYVVYVYDIYESEVYTFDVTRTVLSGSRTSFIKKISVRNLSVCMPTTLYFPLAGCYDIDSINYNNMINEYLNAIVYTPEILREDPSGLLDAVTGTYKPKVPYFEKFNSVIYGNITYCNIQNTPSTVNRADLGNYLNLIGQYLDFRDLTYLWYSYIITTNRTVSIYPSGNFYELSHNGKKSGVYLAKTEAVKNIAFVASNKLLYQVDKRIPYTIQAGNIRLYQIKYAKQINKGVSNAILRQASTYDSTVNYYAYSWGVYNSSLIKTSNMQFNNIAARLSGSNISCVPLLSSTGANFGFCGTYNPSQNNNSVLGMVSYGAGSINNTLLAYMGPENVYIGEADNNCTITKLERTCLFIINEQIYEKSYVRTEIQTVGTVLPQYSNTTSDAMKAWFKIPHPYIISYAL